jgi:hypothetical protein
MHLTGMRRIFRNKIKAVALFWLPSDSRRKLRSELRNVRVQWTKDTIGSPIACPDCKCWFKVVAKRRPLTPLSRGEKEAMLLRAEEGTMGTIVSCSLLVLHHGSRHAKLQIREKETVDSFC